MRLGRRRFWLAFQRPEQEEHEGTKVVKAIVGTTVTNEAGPTTTAFG
jgi:hypothetical protein